LNKIEVYKSSPKVSVLLAVYNEENFIKQTIESTLAQSFTNFEFIIIVNCSNDNTVDIIKSFDDERIKLFETEICQLAFNLNYGLNKALGSYILRIDADDIAEPNRLEKQLNVIENFNYDVVGSNLTYIDQNDIIIGEKVYPQSNEDIRKRIFHKSVIAHPATIYKKEAILKVGGYMNGKVSEDYDLWIRLMRNKSIKFYNIQENLTKYRIHSAQAKGDKYAYAEIAGYFLREAIYKKSLKSFVGSIIYILKAFFR